MLYTIHILLCCSRYRLRTISQTHSKRQQVVVRTALIAVIVVVIVVVGAALVVVLIVCRISVVLGIAVVALAFAGDATAAAVGHIA